MTSNSSSAMPAMYEARILIEMNAKDAQKAKTINAKALPTIASSPLREWNINIEAPMRR